MLPSLLLFGTLLKGRCFSRNLSRKGSKTEAPARPDLRVFYHMLTGAEFKKAPLRFEDFFSELFGRVTWRRQASGGLREG